MKIVRVTATEAGCYSFDFHPDSALLLQGRPMFYPGFGEGWLAVPHVAVRLNRLGKCVAEKFAQRYYDALSAAIVLELPGAAPHMEGRLSGMDISLTHGEWLGPDDFLSLGGMSCGGEDVRLSVSRADVDLAVAEVSRLTTIKMGDIILLPLGAKGWTLARHSRLVVAASPSGRELLNVKVV